MKYKFYSMFSIMALLLSLLFLISCDDVTINTQYFYNDAEAYKVGEGAVDASLIKHIDIDWIVGNVFVDVSDSNEIKFFESYSSDITDDLRMHYNISGNTLYIKFAKSTKSLLFNGSKKNLYIHVPKDAVLDSYECNMVSSSTTIKALNADTIHIDSVSGTIDCYNLNSKYIIFDSTSGNIYSKNITTNEFTIESTSGKITIENIKSNSLNIDTTSGNILCTSLEIQEVETESSSSSIILRFKTSPSEIEVDSISGNIFLYLPREMEFMMNYDTVSGNLSHSFALSKNDSNSFDYSTQNPTSILDIKSISGNLDIDFSN